MQENSYTTLRQSPIPDTSQRAHRGDMSHTTRPRRPGHAALRRGRVSEAGRYYLLTSVTRQRLPRFAAFDAGCRVAAVISDARLWRESRVLAWVLMPDHWHGLIELGGADRLDGLMCRMKTNTARAVRGPGEVARPLWARAFHDRALRREEDVSAVARYVVANPLRAGLVQRLGDYPFWDAVWLTPDFVL